MRQRRRLVCLRVTVDSARKAETVTPEQRSWRRPRRTTVIELTVFAGLAIAYNFVRSAPGSQRHGSRSSMPVTSSRVEGWVFDHLEVPLNEWMVASPQSQSSPAISTHCCTTPRRRSIFFLSRRRGGWQYWRGYWALVIASGHGTDRLRALCGCSAAIDSRSRHRRRDESLLAVRLVGLGCFGAARHRRRHQPVRGDAVDALRLGLVVRHPDVGLRGKTWRTLAVTYPVVLLVVVLGTGNHFVLDVVAGAACVVVAYGVVALIGRIRVISRPAIVAKGNITNE